MTRGQNFGRACVADGQLAIRRHLLIHLGDVMEQIETSRFVF